MFAQIEEGLIKENNMQNCPSLIEIQVEPFFNLLEEFYDLFPNKLEE